MLETSARLLRLLSLLQARRDWSGGDSLRALAKLEQVLPTRLRHQVNALQTYTVAVPADGVVSTVDASVLTALATACRDHQRVRFDYPDYDGTSSVRSVEPHRLVCWGRRWYLVAWDTGRQDWRTFRVDRLQPRLPTGPRFTPRDLPEGDVAAYVSRGVSSAAWRHRARVTLHAPIEAVADRVTPAVGVLEAVDDHTIPVCSTPERTRSTRLPSTWGCSAWT